MNKKITNKKTIIMIASIFIVALFLGTAVNPALAELPKLSPVSDSKESSVSEENLKLEMEKLIKDLSAEKKEEPSKELISEEPKEESSAELASEPDISSAEEEKIKEES